MAIPVLVGVGASLLGGLFGGGGGSQEPQLQMPPPPPIQPIESTTYEGRNGGG